MHLMLHVRIPGVRFFHRVRRVLHPPCYRERDDERQGATTLFCYLNYSRRDGGRLPSDRRVGIEKSPLLRVLRNLATPAPRRVTRQMAK
jgi:hypothetical protein